MLSKLTVKNVALIESAEISFCEGLNVLSGETGAGKSVLLDSVNFVLGAKADKTMIRYGETECFVRAEFVVAEDSAAVLVLKEMDVDSDGLIVISRKFTDAGKSVIKINGNAVTAAMLRRVTDYLVDVHGQSEHFFLLKESNQLKTLDEVVGKPLLEEKAKLAEKLSQRKEIYRQMQVLGGDEEERNRRLDLLKYQIDEIEKVALQEGEEEDLLAKRNKMNNTEKIIAALKGAWSAFSEEGGALDGIRYAKRSLSSISHIDTEYNALSDRIEALLSEAEDVEGVLGDLGEEVYYDEKEAEEIESRLDLIKSLKKKYGSSKDEIDEYLQKITTEYELLTDCEGKFAQLTKDLDEVQADIYQICLRLTKLRKTEGEAFCTRVTEELKTLRIGSARFEINFNEYTEEDVVNAGHNGLDEITFLFSANAGEPLKPLGKIISGGEMSRFMLAIKTQLSTVNEIDTYIFDEIDAGISGQTAKTVAEKFVKIAKGTQIIAVSHLAQIAAASDKEFLIEKEETAGKTLTKVKALSETEKVGEVVRLLGGELGDVFAEKHAKELIKQAETYKNSLN